MNDSGAVPLALRAGKRPAATPTTSAARPVATNGRQSVATVAAGAVEDETGSSPSKSSVNQSDAMVPSAPAITARRALSASRPRIKCQRLAPTAERIASSRSRAMARACRRLVTLAIATASTSSARALSAAMILGV